MSRTCCRENFLFFPIAEIYNNTNENLGLNRGPQLFIFIVLYFTLLYYI